MCRLLAYTEICETAVHALRFVNMLKILSLHVEKPYTVNKTHVVTFKPVFSGMTNRGRLECLQKEVSFCTKSIVVDVLAYESSVAD